MKITLVRADPAGNITALVITPIAPQDYAAVSAYILQHGIVQAQQVGFVTAPHLGGAVRLEMMGGEFCGNALRSTGLFWAQTQNMKGICSIEVEISGAHWPLTITVDPKTGFSSAQMPLPKLMEEHVFYGQRYIPVVLEGIVHLICEALPQEVGALDRTMLEACERFQRSACGIMFFDRETKSMTPVVYVAKTSSIVYEGSCASGTTALAAVLARRATDGAHTYPIRQPGGEITAFVQKTDGRITDISIGGVVHISAQTEWEIPISDSYLKTRL